MLPVFKEYRSMLYSFGLDLSEYDDDKLWIDRLIIRGFDKNGKSKRICKLSVTDDLQYNFKFYPDKPDNKDLISYDFMYHLREPEISELEEQSVSVIKRTINEYPFHKFVLKTSCGKDSKLTEYLLKKVTNDYETVFNNTTVDCTDVYKEVLSDSDIRIITPVDKNGKYKSFYKMVNTVGVPRRGYRWCCSHFKETATDDVFKDVGNIVFFMGMRNDESSARSKYKDIEIRDGWEKIGFVSCLPIRNWNEINVWLYTIKNGITINAKYKKGYSRVGCAVVCPFYTKSTWVLDKYWYKKMFDRWHTVIDNQFLNGEQWCINNCTRDEYHLNWNNGILRDNPTDEVVEEFMGYKGITDKTVALQYFNKTCSVCGKRVYNKNEVAMNLKYFGREISKFKCKKCLMKELEITKDDWDLKVKGFKEQGCKLF